MLSGGGRGWWATATLPLTQAAEVDCVKKPPSHKIHNNYAYSTAISRSHTHTHTHTSIQFHTNTIQPSGPRQTI